MKDAPPTECCYFNDRKRKVDFVIVIKSLASLITYIRNLEKVGVEFEVAAGQDIRKEFLLIHLPQKTLQHFANVYNVGIKERRAQDEILPFTFAYTTPISHMPPKVKGEFTTAERVTILHELLENASYGNGQGEKGISNLIRANLVEDAYPLHDGPIHEDVLAYANDRQLLLHYWANFEVWYKEMPLDMIKKYFGCEIAFHFAWLEYLNYMLIPAVILGTIVTLINVILLVNFPISRVEEVCNAHNMPVCRTCEFSRYCVSHTLDSFCLTSKLSYVFDNYLTLGFAVFMSFWAILFTNGWRHRENNLMFKWDVQSQNPVLDARKEFLDSTKTMRPNSVTGKLEPFVPKYVYFLRISFSVCSFIITISLILAGNFGVRVWESTIPVIMDLSNVDVLKKYGEFIAVTTAALLQVIFIKLFDKAYKKMAIWITDIENPRTQLQYDKSFLYKTYMVSFLNNYAPFFYIAFFKGQFFTVPNRHVYLSVFESDTCQPLTCISDLWLMLIFYFMFKRFAGNIRMCLIQSCKSWCQLRHIHTQKQEPDLKILQYEEEYKLRSPNRFSLVHHFCDLVNEYGLVTFFVAAFPLAPLCVLLNNLLDARVHAHDLITKYRRPIPKSTGGIEAWNGILSGVTYLSIVTNAFVIAFTSDFITRVLYRHKEHHYMHGYVNSTLSTFATKDSPQTMNNSITSEVCYYRAKRNPPHHPMRYELTREFWIDVTWRLICVLIFEHIILFCSRMISYATSDIPKHVKEQRKKDKRLAKQARQSADQSKENQIENRTGPPPGTLKRRNE